MHCFFSPPKKKKKKKGGAPQKKKKTPPKRHWLDLRPTKKVALCITRLLALWRTCNGATGVLTTPGGYRGLHPQALATAANRKPHALATCFRRRPNNMTAHLAIRGPLHTRIWSPAAEGSIAWRLFRQNAHSTGFRSKSECRSPKTFCYAAMLKEPMWLGYII